MALKSSKANLTIVSDDIYHLDRKPESPSERIRRLQSEARILAREEIEELVTSLKALAKRAKDVADGGEAYPAGIRELSSRLSEDLFGRIDTYQSLMARLPEPKIR
jgi:hypothetical protein